MNFLAHLFLAGDTPESLIGNLAGDFVKGPLGDRFPPAIAEGLRRRGIDVTTTSDAGLTSVEDLDPIATALASQRVIDTNDENYLILSSPFRL